MLTKLSYICRIFHFLIFYVVQFCKRPSQSIFSLASNSSSLVLLCKIWGVSKSLKSFMSAPRIGKDQQQFLENIGSSKLDNYILRSIPFAKSNINVEYVQVWRFNTQQSYSLAKPKLSLSQFMDARCFIVRVSMYVMPTH